MKLSKNLTLAEMIRSESAKRYGIYNAPTHEHSQSMLALAKNIFQPLRDAFGVPIHISSGYRSEALNKRIGGAKSSQHLKGQAMDIDMDLTIVMNANIFKYIKDNLDFDQLIWEFGNDKNPDWVHVSYNDKAEKQRGQILKATRNAQGKTVYTQIS